MPLEPANVTIYSNEWFYQTVRLLGPDKVTPIDLTGFSASCEIGPADGCGEPLVAANVGSGVVIDHTEGRITTTIPLDVLVPAGVVVGGTYRYKLSLIDPTGRPRVYRHGKLKVIC